MKKSDNMADSTRRTGQIRAMHSGQMIYLIKVQGRLPESWLEMYGDVRLQEEEYGGITCTRLSCRVPDAAALHGILHSLYSLGMPLLLVECLGQE